MNKTLAVALAVALAGCSAFESSPSPDPLQRAATIGAEAGHLACLAAVVKKPEARTALQTAVDEAKLALTSPAPTLAAITRALDRLPNDDNKVLIQAAFSSLVVVLSASGNPVPNLPPDSPVGVGVAAFVAGCEAALL